MLEKCDFHNNDGTVYSLNSVVAPLKVFDVTVEERTDVSREKSQEDGLNATRTRRGGMEIHVEGDLFRETSADYVTERKALVRALYGDPAAAIDQTLRKLGFLQINLAGETEDWKTNSGVTITLFSAPVNALYPALTNFAITFMSWDDHWTGVTTGTKYRWS